MARQEIKRGVNPPEVAEGIVPFPEGARMALLAIQSYLDCYLDKQPGLWA